MVRKIVIGHMTCSGRNQSWLCPLQVTQPITTFLSAMVLQYFLSWNTKIPKCSNEAFSRTPRLKEANLRLKKKLNKKDQLSNFAFMFYGSFPTRNGSKSTIANQKYDKVNKATVMSDLCLNLFFQPQNRHPSLGGLLQPWEPSLEHFGFLVFQLRKC